MRRLFVLIGLALVFALPAPAAAHVPTKGCAISVDPGRGGPRDTYRITGRHFPLAKNGGSLEVRIDVSRVVFGENGPRLEGKTIFFAFLIPGVHTFYIDYNESIEGEVSRLRPGHYVVAAQTPHQKGCHTVSGFDVVRGG